MSNCNTFVYLVLLFICCSSVRARSASNSQLNTLPGHSQKLPTENGDNSIPYMWKDLSMVYKLYQQCAKENLTVCLKVKLLAGIERVLRSAKTLKIMDGIQYIPINDENTTKKPSFSLVNEKDIEAALPRTADAKDYVLNNLIFKKISNFLQDHTLQIKFPDVRNEEDLTNNSVESRKKKEKKGGGAYIMIPLLLGGTFVPIAYGALAMLAGKALIVSKLALVLASIIGIKKLLSGGGKESSHEVVVSSGGHSDWGRDIDLAYNGWKPAGKEPIKNV